MKEFTEISLSGGKVIFGKNGSCTFSHSNPYPCTIGQQLVTTDVEYIYDDGSKSKQQIDIPVLLTSDRCGFFGRACPKCKLYFRTHWSSVCYCPYCGHKDISLHFTTNNQFQYINHYCIAVLNSLINNQETVIDIDEIINNLTNNKQPEWFYSEEVQQFFYKCKKCKMSYDIKGEYGGCPGCGKRNSLDVLSSKFKMIQDRIERKQSYSYEMDLVEIISEFDAFGKDVYILLMESEKDRISFQNIQKAARVLQEKYHVNMFDDTTKDEVNILLKLFQQRHLIVHNAGRVDQKYLDISNDTDVRLGQKINITQSDLLKFLNILIKISTKYYDIVHSSIFG